MSKASTTKGSAAHPPAARAFCGAYGLAALVLVAAFGLPSQVHAQDGWSGTLTLGVGVARIQEGDFLRVHPQLLVDTPTLRLASAGLLFDEDVEERVRVQTSLPLHWRLAAGEGDPVARFRRADWDETEDFFRILRVVELGAPSRAVHLRAGELANVRVGNRTVVDQFRNVVEADRFRWGVQASADTRIGGAELLVDSVLDPGVVGGRIVAPFLQPLRLGALADKVQLGGSLVLDPAAPRTLEREDSGQFTVDSRGRLVVERSAIAAVLGVDVSLPVALAEDIVWTPYADVNALLGFGTGLHLGSRLGGVSRSGALGWDVRAEAIVVGEGYAPRYFGPLYQIERTAWRAVGTGTQRLPRLEWLRSEEPGVALGGFGEVGVRWTDQVHLELAAWDQQGRGGAGWWTRLTLQPIPAVRLALWWVRSEADRLADAFVPADAFVLTELTVAWTPWLYSSAYGSRRFVANGNGRYDTVPEGGVLVGAQVRW